MYILFDIGATKMRFAASRDLESFGDPVIVENSREYMHDIVAMKGAIEKLSGGKHPHGLAGGIAGNFDKQKGVLTHSPNMPDWVGKPIAQDLRRMTGVVPFIYNDADMAGVGEATYGAGHGFERVAYFTVSTGVGGALIINGRPFVGRTSLEPGWQVVNYETKETLHGLAAGKDLEEKYGVHPKYLSDQVYTEVAERLAVGLYNAILMWSPDVIVMGGSQMRDIEIEHLEAGLQEHNNRALKLPLPPVVRAKLGDSNGLFGAMALMKQLAR